jgi:PKD repeat protein
MRRTSTWGSYGWRSHGGLGSPGRRPALEELERRDLPTAGLVQPLVVDPVTQTSAALSKASATSPLVANAGPDRVTNEGTAITFAGSATGGAGALSYRWDFGDGTGASGTLSPRHTYADNGAFLATLTVTDPLGHSSQDSARVTVTNVAPTPAITTPPGSPAPGGENVFWVSNPQGLHNATFVTPEVYAPGDTLNEQKYPTSSQDYWLGQGITPLRWREGYTYKNELATESDFVSNWVAADRMGYRGIGIDEFGDNVGGTIDQKMADALRQTRAQAPNLFIAVWQRRAHMYASSLDAFRDAADLVMVEVYTSATTGLDKVFGPALANLRAAHIAQKAVFALGINDLASPAQRASEGTWANSKAALLAQVKWVRANAPEMPGIAFFAPDGSPTLVAYADQLAGQYFPRFSGTVGSPITVGGTATDPSPVDTAAGFGYSWSVSRYGGVVASGSGPGFRFTPADSGTYVLTLTVTDKDGGTNSTSRVLSVANAISAAALLAPASSGAGLSALPGVDPHVLTRAVYLAPQSGATDPGPGAPGYPSLPRATAPGESAEQGLLGGEVERATLDRLARDLDDPDFAGRQKAQD